MAAPRGKWAGKLDGFDAALHLYKKYEKDVDENFADMMETWARRIFALSQIYCPTSEGGDWPATEEAGYLRSSGQVNQGGNGFSWVISYSAWYAAYVHEMPEGFYSPPRYPSGQGGPYHKPPTRWKFLEFAVSELALEMSRDLQQNLGVMFRSFDTEENTITPAVLEMQQ